MQSSDREILLDIQGQIYRVNTRLDRVEAQQTKTDNDVQLLALTVREIDKKFSARISDLYFYYGLMIIGLLIALWIFFAALFALAHKEKPEYNPRRLSDYEIENMINNKIIQALKDNKAG